MTTIEGLSPDGNHPLQKAWVELGVPQCGFCQAGQIMTAAALLAKNPRPTDARDRSVDGRQPVPVRHVRAHPRGDQEGRGSGRDEPCASLVLPRRSFLRGLNLAVGGLALGYYFPAQAQRPTNEPGKPPGPSP